MTFAQLGGARPFGSEWPDDGSIGWPADDLVVERADGALALYPGSARTSSRAGATAASRP